MTVLNKTATSLNPLLSMLHHASKVGQELLLKQDIVNNPIFVAW